MAKGKWEETEERSRKSSKMNDRESVEKTHRLLRKMKGSLRVTEWRMREMMDIKL